ncbi:hypothetical protein ACFLZM_05555, partial [Thermodesulfobacteriota bacterium]
RGNRSHLKISIVKPTINPPPRSLIQGFSSNNRGCTQRYSTRQKDRALGKSCPNGEGRPWTTDGGRKMMVEGTAMMGDDRETGERGTAAGGMIVASAVRKNKNRKRAPGALYARWRPWRIK